MTIRDTIGGDSAPEEERDGLMSSDSGVAAQDSVTSTANADPEDARREKIPAWLGFTLIMIRLDFSVHEAVMRILIALYCGETNPAGATGTAVEPRYNILN